MKNQIQKAQRAICTNKQKHTATGSSAQHNVSITQQLRGHTHFENGECWCVTAKHIPSNHDESIRNWMIQTIFKTKKKMGEGEGVEGWDSPPSLCLQSYVYRTRLKFYIKSKEKKKNNAWVGGKRWSSHYTPLSTPSPNHFYLTEPFWKHPVFSLVFMVLINVWVTGASHSREILVFCPVALLRAGWTQQHLLWPVPFAAWSESIFVCNLDTMQPRALRASQSISWCRVRVGGKRHAEEWCHLAPSTLRVEKSRLSVASTTQFQCFMAHILHFQWGPAAYSKKSTQHSRFSTLWTPPTFP